MSGLLSILGSILSWFLGFITQRDKSEELGQAEVYNQDQAKVIDDVQKAQDARDTVKQSFPADGVRPPDDGFSRD